MMIYSFYISSIPVQVYDSLLKLEPIKPGTYMYSFATNSKSCLDISCGTCPIYTEGDCTSNLRQAILTQTDIASKFPELLI